MNAVLRPVSQEPELRYVTGGTAHYLATGASTNGQFGLYRWNMPEQQGGPAPHFHRTISESFYVLEGAVQLYDGTAWVDAVPGDFLFVPEGGIHAFRNPAGPASILILFAPGAPREDYFETLGPRRRGPAAHAGGVDGVLPAPRHVLGRLISRPAGATGRGGRRARPPRRDGRLGRAATSR